ncbi:MAG TPA: hypothetical protein VK674_07470 [Candidatus Limnocylindria bacterium]|nr:hypothetical protein [Candidatus Limnocylindria bacterium]
MNAATYKQENARQAGNSADFWLVSKAATSADALYALYYLPKRYKLMVVGTEGAPDFDELANHRELIDRIQFETAEASQAALFSFAHAVISGTQKDGSGQSFVTVSGQGLQDQAAYTVPAGNPPALASAIHKLSRAAG